MNRRELLEAIIVVTLPIWINVIGFYALSFYVIP